MEPGDSLPYLHERDTGSCSQPDEYKSLTHTHYLRYALILF
jgi:hypothetical protein